MLINILALLLFQKKEWLCLNCQTQRALSGKLGDIPAPVAPPMGSPRQSATTSHQTPQQKGPNLLSGPLTTGPQQQQKATGPQVSDPVSPVKQAVPASHTKRPSQASPQTKGSTHPKGSAQPQSQTKGLTQPSTLIKGPQIKGSNQVNSQVKGPILSTTQIKGPGQAKGPTQAKGSTQSSAQTKGPSSGKASSGTGKSTPSHAKVIPTQSKTATTQSKPTGNIQARKQQLNQEKTKVTSKVLEEDVKASPKKALSETITSPKDMKVSEDAQTTRHHEVSYLQLLRLHMLLLIYHSDFFDVLLNNCIHLKKSSSSSLSTIYPLMLNLY